MRSCHMTCGMFFVLCSRTTFDAFALRVSGHAALAVGPYSIALDNGPARAAGVAQALQVRTRRARMHAPMGRRSCKL